MLGGIITIVGGIIAASSLIVARKPNARELIDKLVPYQGWIGIVMFCWGVWELFGSLTHIGFISQVPLRWTFWLLSGVADFGVGFLLGFGLLSKYALSKNATAQARGQELRARLVKFQVPLGMLATAMGVLYILFIYI
jgi:hypothetical protein